MFFFFCLFIFFFFFFFLMIRRPPRSTLFPYTRSSDLDVDVALAREPRQAVVLERRPGAHRSEEHTSELQSRPHLVCRLLLEKKKKKIKNLIIIKKNKKKKKER